MSIRFSPPLEMVCLGGSTWSAPLPFCPFGKRSPGLKLTFGAKGTKGTRSWKPGGGCRLLETTLAVRLRPNAGWKLREPCPLAIPWILTIVQRVCVSFISKVF